MIQRTPISLGQTLAGQPLAGLLPRILLLLCASVLVAPAASQMREPVRKPPRTPEAQPDPGARAEDQEGPGSEERPSAETDPETTDPQTEEASAAGGETPNDAAEEGAPGATGAEASPRLREFVPEEAAAELERLRDGAATDLDLEQRERLQKRVRAFLERRDAPTLQEPRAELQDLLCLSSYAWEELEDYSGMLHKKERSAGGKFQAEERILVKYRKLHDSLYMKWKSGDKKGRELLFSEHLDNGRMKMVVAAGAWVLFDRHRVQSLDPTSSSALEGTFHPHTEYTIGAILGRFRDDWCRALRSTDGQDLLGVRYRGKWERSTGRRGVPECYVFDVWFRALDEHGQPYAYGHSLLGFDPETLLLVAFEGSELRSHGGTLREGALMAKYHLHHLSVDPRLPAEDFSPLNPKYRFAK